MLAGAVVTVAAAVTAGTALADTTGAVSAAAITTTVGATADTYVVVERPALAYGTQAKLTAANWSTPWHSEAYLRFAVPAPPAGQTIAGARLELTFTKLDEQPGTVELRSLTGAWSESTTYATRPAVGAVVATATLPGQGQAGVSFDVTAAVQAAGRVDFALANPSAQSVASVHSREQGADGPRLVLVYGDPTPTLCGASFNVNSGESWQEALERTDGYYDGMEMVRVFYSGLPQAWPGKLDAGGRPIVVSFKAPPAQVIAGQHDARLRDWFRTAPTDQDIYWTYQHEPENDIDEGRFTAAQFRQAWQRLSGLADEAGNPRLRATLILMGWSLNPSSGRDWRDYYPGRSFIDVLGWDIYNPGWNAETPAYRTPAEIYERVVQTSNAEGLPFGIGETGSPLIAGDGGTRRATWLRDIAAYLTDHGALWVAYFDLNWSNADYRLRDAPSMAAWAEFCN
jgi:hypothetical protein